MVVIQCVHCSRENDHFSPLDHRRCWSVSSCLLLFLSNGLLCIYRFIQTSCPTRRKVQERMEFTVCQSWSSFITKRWGVGLWNIIIVTTELTAYFTPFLTFWKKCLITCVCVCVWAAGSGDHLYGHQASHFHTSPVWLLHRRRSFTDQPAHLSGTPVLRQEICPGGRSPTAATDSTKSGGEVHSNV